MKYLEKVDNRYDDAIGDCLVFPENSLIVFFEIYDMDEFNRLVIEAIDPDDDESPLDATLVMVNGSNAMFHFTKIEGEPDEPLPFNKKRLKNIMKMINGSKVIKNISVRYALDSGSGFSAQWLKNSIDKHVIECIKVLKSAKSLHIFAHSPNQYADETIKKLLTEFNELEELMIYGGLKSFPEDEKLLSKLKVAYFEYIGAKGLEKALRGLSPRLELLAINLIKFKKLPNEIGKFTNLTHLEITYSDKFDGMFPDSFKNLKKLEYLDISFNPIETFPEIIYEVAQNLKYLSIEGCDIEKLPDAKMFPNIENTISTDYNIPGN